MASAPFCPPIAHLPAHARASSTAIPAAAENPGKKAPSPSAPPAVQRVSVPSDPKRPWWAPIFLSTSRRPEGSDRTAGEWVAAPARKRSEDGDEISAKAAGRKRSGLTAEKARVLRREMRATEAWHDAMYHSAIATRLASPDEL